LLKVKKKKKKKGYIPVYAMKAYRRSRGIASLILDVSTRRMYVVNFMP